MLNVVIITSGFAVDESDLVCVPFLQLYIQDLLKQGVKITVITTQYPATENYTWNGVDVMTITKKEPKLITKILFKYRLTKALQAIYQKNKIDVIHHIWFNNEVYVSDEFATKHNIKHITTFAGQDVLPENRALKKIDSYKGELVCVTKFQQLKLNETTDTKSSVIHWGIEHIAVSNNPRPIDLISCGWLNPLKNHGQFIDIVYELSKERLVQKAVICGSGSELLALDNKIKTLKLQRAIELRGSVPRSEVIMLMKKSKFLIHTSTYEGFGLVMAEALACGCSVISKPVGIAYDNYMIKTCDTTDEFVSEIRRQLKQSLHNDFHNPYLISNTTASYLDLYQK